MNSGSFFSLDLESSKVVSGITFYNYIDAPDLFANKNELRYPIKLSISSDSVSFFVHYYKDDYYPHHLEDIILKLPFGTNEAELLSSTIKRVYSSEFPLSDYLVELLSNRYINECEEYELLQKSQINKDSYSSLYIWGLLKNQEEQEASYQIQDRDGKITGFLRKILLDFMFDLMHSDVFETSKYYSQMKEGLMKDFFFESIIKKCEYYYYRRLIRSRFKTIGGDSDYVLSYSRQKRLSEDKKQERLIKKKERLSTRINRLKFYYWESRAGRKLMGLRLLLKPRFYLIKLRGSFLRLSRLIEHEKTNAVLYSIKRLYAERLEDAESTWVETIMSPEAEKHFAFSPDWFDEKKHSEQHEDFAVSDSWFVNPEEEMNRIVFPLNNKITGKKHFLNSYELSKLIGSKNNSSVVDRNTRISKWFYRRFDFKHTFRLHLFHGWNEVFAVSLLLLFAFAVASSFYPLHWAEPKYVAIIPIVLCVACVGSCVGFAISAISKRIIWQKRKSLRIDDALVIKRRGHECFRSLRLSMLFLCISLLLCYFKELEPWQVGILCLVLIIVIIVRRSSESGDILHLLLPRLVASITTAWIMLVIGNDLVKEHVSLPICIILLFVVFAFILYENHKTLPNTKKSHVLMRSIELMLISYSISLIIGVFAIDILSPSLFADINNSVSFNEGMKYAIKVEEPFYWKMFPNYSYSWTLTIFPKYLIQFSFLAMFIGVFIQMIFEEKNITEL